MFPYSKFYVWVYCNKDSEYRKKPFKLLGEFEKIIKVLKGNAHPVNVTDKIITKHTDRKGEKVTTKVRLAKL